ncbi:transcription-silencing protein Clr2-domain-containing protein [Calycina marina]|uniref:Transcription-silencing protein Clr2-domain-containing protein n=1 Tax=Calycina marina TaxID=1763456 RepID=A0A9P7ZA46_9HELO|nr:transcription-silencing protein Clr2-domain-containing protein [Calycina marina]
MAFYVPITVARSDGQLEVVLKGIKELNQPTRAQFDDTPDSTGMVDCYRRLAFDDPKSVDWRRKIGGMLKNYFGLDSNKQFILQDLPEHYILWEHVKYRVDKLTEGKREKGKHAAGIYERQDAYLYGHPQGRKKRYRSPADFFHHVLFLVAESKDWRDCSCKICSPDGDEEVVEVVPKVEASIRRDTKPKVVIDVPRVNPTYQAPPLPSKSREQLMDASPKSRYLYRPGELVWFNKGNAWGLAVIGRRGLINDRARYLVQPLSHSIQHLPPQVKNKQEDIRPWLAWSVPSVTIPALQNLTFENVPWDRVVCGEYGQGDPQVDGSILAAKTIDSSYSLFDRVENAIIAPNEVQYSGMFLGAEKIWVGEPVRLNIPGIDDIAVLIIDRIIERTSTSPPGSMVEFVGDVYKYVEMPNQYRSRAEWPTPQELPKRMVADIQFRNEVSDNAGKRIWHEWRLLEPAARRGLSDIKGRWYETSTLLPVLRGLDQYKEDLFQGLAPDSSIWMNSRGLSSMVGGQRKKNRRDTLGASVPADFKVSRGLDGNPADDLFPDTPTPQQTLLQLHHKYSDHTEMDEFMNL